MNYTKLFYWLTVADNAKTMFTVFIVIFTAIAVISTIWFLGDRQSSDFSCRDGMGGERAKKWMWYSFPFMILFWSLYVFTPSKKDALLIVAGGQTMNFLTTDSTAKKIPSELTNFVVSELRNMASEAKVELNISNQKEKIQNEAKSMTIDELLNKMKTDSIFAKIVLEK